MSDAKYRRLDAVPGTPSKIARGAIRSGRKSSRSRTVNGISGGVPARLRKDPMIERWLKSFESGPEAASATVIVSVLARRGTDLQTLRRVVEAFEGMKPGRRTARALDILKRAVIRDSRAAVVLSSLLEGNHALLALKTDVLILFSRIYSRLEDPKTIDRLQPVQVEELTAALNNTIEKFSTAPGDRPIIEEIFFTVLNDKLREETKPEAKAGLMVLWAENLISILDRTVS